MVEEEMEKMATDKDLAGHIEKLRACIVDSDKFIPMLESLQSRNAELQVECDQLAE